MRNLGPAATDPTDLITLAEAQALLDSGSAGGMGIKYGQTKALAKLLLSLGLINSAAVPIVLGGDSITRGYRDGTNISTKPYVTRIYDRLTAAFPKDSGSHPALTVTTTPTAFGSQSAGLNVFNVGIASTHSGNYMDSTLRTAVGAANPRAVIHNIGTNDYRFFGTSVADFKTNIQTVISDLKTKTAGPCVHILLHHYATITAQSGMPVAPWADYGTAKKQIAEADPDNVAFIDLSAAYSLVGVQASGADPLGLVSDGIHPTDAGHLALGDLSYIGIFGGP